MIGGGKHEAKADFLYALRYLLGTKLDTYTQRFQYISAAAATGSGTVAVFCHCCASCSRENTGTRRDIERTSAIATCATGVQGPGRDILFQVNLHRFFAHHSRQSCYFLHTFPARAQAQRRQKSSHLCLRGNTSHNFFHYCRRLVLAQSASGYDVRNRLPDHDLLLSQFGTPPHSRLGWACLQVGGFAYLVLAWVAFRTAGYSRA